MRIVTYNICHGGYAELDLARLGRAIADIGADLAGLQEVDQLAKRSGNIDSLARLIEGSGLPDGRFTHSIDFQGGEYGTAQLSRYPILSHTVHPLPSGKEEARAFGHMTVDWGGTRLHFINTHLSLGGAENRAPQFDAIAAALPAEEPWIVTGDFNTEDYAEFARLGGTSVNHGERRMGSYYPDDRAIDHILLSPHFTLTAWGMVDSPLSDHNALWCDVTL